MICNDKEQMDRLSVYGTKLNAAPGNAERNHRFRNSFGPPVGYRHSVSKPRRLQLLASNYKLGKLADFEIRYLRESTGVKDHLSDCVELICALQVPDYAAWVEVCH